MTLDELQKSIDDKAPKLKGIITAFDLDFIGHAYLAALYIAKVDNRIPSILTNIKQLTILGAALVRNYDLLRDELKDFIPSTGVPIRDNLEHRWVAGLSVRLDNEQVKERLQTLIKGIK
jgi:hypothetical protein